MDDGARVGELGGLALASAAAHRLRQQGIEEGQGFVEEVRDKRYEVMLHPDADLPEVTIGLQSVLADWFEGRAGSTERLAVAHDTAMNHGLYDVDISEPPFAGKPAELLGLAEGLGNVLTVSEALVENGFVDTYRPDETSLGTELARGSGQDN